MKIAVLVKTVGFVYAQTGYDLKKNCIAPEDVVTMVNPLDEAALESALRLKDSKPGVTVTAMALGDETAEEGLRKSLALGVDDAIHIKIAGRDSLDARCVSELLARACKGEKFDLILCGATSIDDNDGLEGPYLAERLAIPHLTNVVELNVMGGRAAVQRVVERGDRQLMECTLPALLTIQKGAVPRYPTLAGSLRAKTAPIRVIGLDQLGMKGTDLAVSLNVTEVVEYCKPRPRRRPEGTRTQFSAATRVGMFVNRDSSKQKEGAAIVEGATPQMFAKLDEILVKAGILKQ